MWSLASASIYPFFLIPQTVEFSLTGYTLEALLDAATGHYTDAYDKITPFVGLHICFAHDFADGTLKC